MSRKVRRLTPKRVFLRPPMKQRLRNRHAGQSKKKIVNITEFLKVTLETHPRLPPSFLIPSGHKAGWYLKDLTFKVKYRLMTISDLYFSSKLKFRKLSTII